MITSRQNPKIQWVRGLETQPRLRREEGVFVVEGVRLVEEAARAGWTVRLGLYTEDLSERGKATVERMARLGVPLELVSEGVMAKASDTQMPQGILAVVERRSLPMPEILDFVLICDGLRDPGNLGTLLRTAAAVGVQAVVLTPGSVDGFAPKVVRAAMGAHFRLPVVEWDWAQVAGLREVGVELIVADAGEGEAYTDVDLRQPLGLVIGGEAHGVSAEARELAQRRVHIPMAGEVESLNAATAAAVILFEARRQRKM